MAAITAESFTQIVTLAGATLDTVTLGSSGYVSHKFVEVVNWGTANRLSFTVDGTTPVADGAGARHLGPGQSIVVASPNDPDVIKLISTSGTTYSVAGSN